jgi:hypothetical protein
MLDDSRGVNQEESMKVEPSVEAKLKSELEAIEKRQSELKEELDGIVKTLPRLSEEMANLDKDIGHIRLHAQPKQNSILCRIRHSVQQGWRSSGLFFATAVVLTPVTLAIVIASALEKVGPKAEGSFILGAMTIWMITAALHYKKFGILAASFTVAAAFSVASIWATYETLHWNFVSVSLSIFGLGFAAHAFSSKADSEDHWEETKRELRGINQKLAKLTDGANRQVEEVERKPQADK